MPLGMEVSLDPSHIVLDEDPAPPKRGTVPQFLGHVCCGQMAGLIKMPVGTEVNLGPGHIVGRKGHTSSPLFGQCLLWPNGRPSQLLLSTCKLPHLHLVPPLGVTLSELCQDFRHQKTRVPGLSRGIVCMILRLAMSVEHRLVTDGQTDTR